jgi:hypothetical protein
VKVQAERVPPTTEHVIDEGENSALGPVAVTETDVSLELNPDPETVIACPVFPGFGESEITGPLVTVKS